MVLEQEKFWMLQMRLSVPSKVDEGVMHNGVLMMKVVYVMLRKDERYVGCWNRVMRWKVAFVSSGRLERLLVRADSKILK